MEEESNVLTSFDEGAEPAESQAMRQNAAPIMGVKAKRKIINKVWRERPEQRRNILALRDTLPTRRQRRLYAVATRRHLEEAVRQDGFKRWKEAGGEAAREAWLAFDKGGQRKELANG